MIKRKSGNRPTGNSCKHRGMKDANAKDIFKELEKGTYLHVIAKQYNVTKQALQQWLLRADEKAYKDAQMIVADNLAVEMIEIADNESLDPSRARNMLNARQFILERRFQRLYGAKQALEVTGKNGVPLMQPVINLTMASPVKALSDDVIESDTIDD